MTRLVYTGTGVYRTGVYRTGYVRVRVQVHGAQVLHVHPTTPLTYMTMPL